jgi:transcriptional regulator with XRE-family HTH domain
MTNKINDEHVVDVDEQRLRRKKLKTILDKYFFSIASLAEKVNISRGNLSNLLSGNRPFSSYTANKIEAMLALPLGYLSNDNGEEYELSDFIDVKYYEDIKFLVSSGLEKKVKFPKEIIIKLKLNNREDILVTFMNDDLMNPTIKSNEMIFIDCSQRKVEDGMIYLVEVNSFYRVRRLFNKKNAVSVHIDNPNEKDNYVINTIPLSDIDIIGKLVCSLKTF